jgi:type VI secretion system protein ImpJ
MFDYNRVVWSEGMLLQQQHLQQHDRYLHRLIDARCAPRGRYGWGFSTFAIDEAQLAFGKFSLRACEGVMPDGTPFSLPGEGDLPAAIEVPESKRNAEIVLALALARPGISEVEETIGEAPLDDARPMRSMRSAGSTHSAYTRYRRAVYQVDDANARTADSVAIEVARLNLRLAFADEIGDAFAVIGVARVIERRTDQRVALDGAYMPSCIDYRVASPLSAFVDELIGLLRQRAQMLSARLAGPGVAAVDELADFLLLQAVNRYEPLLSHWATTEGLHPETLYGLLLQLAGELAALTRGAVRPLAQVPYRHHALAASFAPVMETIREALSYAAAPNAVAIALEARPHGLQVARVADSTWFATAGFVLAARADMPPDALAAALPLQLKVGPLEKIDDLVSLQLPGVGLRALPTAPRQLPFHAQRCYFALDANDALWPQLATSGALALHVAGDFPGLELRLWAIRQ